MKVLVLAPHPDDESIGCGGTLARHARDGAEITAVFLTSGELGLKKLARAKAWKVREAEARRAARILGIGRVIFLRQPDWMLGECLEDVAEAFRPVVEAEKPDLVYMPHPAEQHPDHKAALPVLCRALAGWAAAKPEIRSYEVWTPLAEFDVVEDITAEMPRKLRALRAHRSQLREFDYARAVRGLNAFRGELAARVRYAEVFQRIAWPPAE